MSLNMRVSKFRNVYGAPFKRDECFENLKIGHSAAGDSNVIKINSKFLSVTWETNGGGAFAVLPLSNPCRVTESQPLFNAHKGSVIDTDFSPFNDHIIASGSEDCSVMVWNIPEEISEHQSSPAVTLLGHQRRVNLVSFHPTAGNILASASSDLSIKIWDVNAGRCCIDLAGHGQGVQSFAFSWTGDSIVSTCRDKMMRIFDARSAAIVHEIPAYDCVKTARAIWAGDQERIITTGFSKTSERQIMLWDTRNMAAASSTMTLDRSPGMLIPYYDRETSVLFIAGKGDSTIMFYEHEDGQLFPLSHYKSTEPQRGIAFMPKRSCKTSVNEMARAFKVHSSLVEPISFIVPRRAAGFQSDIFPPTPGPEQSMTAEEWFGGKSMPPVMIEMDTKMGNSMQNLVRIPSNTQLLDSPLKSESAASPTGRDHDSAAEKNAMLAKLTAKDARIAELETQLAKFICGGGGGSGSGSAASNSGRSDKGSECSRSDRSPSECGSNNGDTHKK